KSLLMIVCLAFSVTAQSIGDYSRAAKQGIPVVIEKKREIVRLHLALALVRLKLDPAQRSFLVKQIGELTIPFSNGELLRSNSVSETRNLFSAELRSQVFERIGSEDVRVYLELSSLKTMSARRAFFSSQPAEEKSNLWRSHFAMHLARPDLTQEQR